MPQPALGTQPALEGCSAAQARARDPDPEEERPSDHRGLPEATLHSDTHRFRPVSSFRLSVSGKGPLPRPAHPGGCFFLIVMYFFVHSFVQSARLNVWESHTGTGRFMLSLLKSSICGIFRHFYTSGCLLHLGWAALETGVPCGEGPSQAGWVTLTSCQCCCD